MLLERLGPNLAARDAGPEAARVVVTTLRSLWRPVDAGVALPTGAEKAAWLGRSIATSWQVLDRPCGRDVIDRAVRYWDERAAALDGSPVVLVHGDAHGSNTLQTGADGFKLVDPEGLRSETAHDLAVPMSEYNEPLLAGDTPPAAADLGAFSANSWRKRRPERDVAEIAPRSGRS